MQRQYGSRLVFERSYHHKIYLQEIYLSWVVYKFYRIIIFIFVLVSLLHSSHSSMAYSVAGSVLPFSWALTLPPLSLSLSPSPSPTWKWLPKLPTSPSQKMRLVAIQLAKKIPHQNHHHQRNNNNHYDGETATKCGLGKIKVRKWSLYTQPLDWYWIQMIWSEPTNFSDFLR